MRKIIIRLCFFFLTITLASEVVWAGNVARIFTDGMVIQRNKPVPVWGEAVNGSSVSVSFNGQTKTTTASGGKWLIRLDSMAAKSFGSAMTIQIGSNQTINLGNILVGDVWFAGGQSNMGQQLKDHLEGAAVQTSNQVRFFKFPLLANPGQNPANWPTWFSSGENQNTRTFSAVAYFFAHKLRETENVPIGIVQSLWGGTPIEAWMTQGTLAADPRFAPILSRGVDFYDGNTFRLPTRLNGTMIKPLQPLAVAGFIWYQGESNTLNNPNSGNFIYRDLFKAMIAEWRRDFEVGNVPFIFAQLTSIFRSNGGNGTEWATLRESQLMNLNETNTAMTVTIDVGERYEIHPLKKRPIGERMALLVSFKFIS